MYGARGSKEEGLDSGNMGWIEAGLAEEWKGAAVEAGDPGVLKPSVNGAL